MADIISVKFNSDNLLAGLEHFQNFITQKVIYTGAATMGRMIYEEVKINTSKYTEVGPPYGFPGINSGNLHRSIYWAKAKKESTPTTAVYVVQFRHTGSIKGGGNHGYWIEYGHWFKKEKGGAKLFWVPPRPFLRPAMSRMHDAINAGLVNMKNKFNEELGL